MRIILYYVSGEDFGSFITTVKNSAMHSGWKLLATGENRMRKKRAKTCRVNWRVYQYKRANSEQSMWRVELSSTDKHLVYGTIWLYSIWVAICVWKQRLHQDDECVDVIISVKLLACSVRCGTVGGGSGERMCTPTHEHQQLVAWQRDDVRAPSVIHVTASDFQRWCSCCCCWAAAAAAGAGAGLSRLLVLVLLL